MFLTLSCSVHSSILSCNHAIRVLFCYYKFIIVLYHINNTTLCLRFVCIICNLFYIFVKSLKVLCILHFNWSKESDLRYKVVAHSMSVDEVCTKQLLPLSISNTPISFTCRVFACNCQLHPLLTFAALKWAIVEHEKL